MTSSPGTTGKRRIDPVVAAYFVTLAAGYLLGSLPTGYLVGRAKGLDLRAVGSGNIGATNALRVLGKPAGIFVLVVDGLKGWAACTILPAVVLRGLGHSSGGPPPIWLPVIGGLAAVLGHNFTCWLKFRGGKGVATSAGVLAGLMPLAFATVLAAFLIVLALSRIVSLGSLVAASILPFAAWYWHREPVLTGLGVALAALVVYRHRANIQRLLVGTEPRLGRKPAAPS